MEWETALVPLLSPLGLELYDVDFSAGTLSVVVTRPGGVDVDTLAVASRALSQWLDETDPIEGRFTLDVSSPGLERRLRTPAHFASAVGERVTLRERRDDAPTRRLEGVVVSSDETGLVLDDAQLGATRVEFSSIERARTVFEWGAAPRAGATSTSRKG